VMLLKPPLRFSGEIIVPIFQQLAFEKLALVSKKLELK